MNAGSDRGKGGTHLAGKEFVIVVVVFFSSLSFTLGFFVGKQSAGKNIDSTVSPAVQSVAQNTVPQSVPTQEMQPAKTDAAAVKATPQGQPGGEKVMSVQPNPPAPAPRAAAEERKPEALNDPVKLVERTPSRETVQDKAPQETARANSQQDGVVYSVQLGALKNPAEARRLKDKYASKGYKTSITVTRLKNKEKVYKVKAGEFRNRRDAELLSLRLKKNEGLHAFVTPRNE